MKDLEKIGKKKIVNISFITEIINHPFYENYNNLFAIEKWNSVKFDNDFFITQTNFEYIKGLMDKNNESYFYLCFAHGRGHIEMFEINKLSDINVLRNFIEENYLWPFDWYFISPSHKWAGISIYDSSILHIGFQN